ncbi:hypothetical protein OGAPHI_005439 [Ogataea philodendri]|uniref:Uncharacterized protein n=1 Tax=Ogataea philodendri TaxID=1378263 RepID=A0A9P8T156_9ASCO|nr:uncharacterized protein OGAPHI_005439 [Ogataea philodendri]KAH3662191.1 hypothetical protein OGAPHI_005439 [Ogataea philodendri]
MIIPEFLLENIQALMAAPDICPSELVGNTLHPRDLDKAWNDTKSGWNKCMDKRWCKIVVIVCIVVGGLFVLWVLSTIFQLICCGAKCIEALCCCCCCGRRKEKVVYKEAPPPSSQGNAYTNPNMYYQQNANPFADQNRYSKQQHF